MRRNCSLCRDALSPAEPWVIATSVGTWRAPVQGVRRSGALSLSASLNGAATPCLLLTLVCLLPLFPALFCCNFSHGGGNNKVRYGDITGVNGLLLMWQQMASSLTCDVLTLLGKGVALASSPGPKAREDFSSGSLTLRHDFSNHTVLWSVCSVGKS